MLLRKLDAIWDIRVQPTCWWFESDLVVGVEDQACERWYGVRAALQVTSWKAPSPHAPVLLVALSRFYQYGSPSNLNNPEVSCSDLEQSLQGLTKPDARQQYFWGL